MSCALSWLGLVAVAALAAVMPFVASQPAFADYAPSKGDVVGVGSDTLQYLIDFLADGDAYADTGYNTIGNHNKLINFDATADASARLAYGVDGGQPGQPSTCTPGTGSTKGTVNAPAGGGLPASSTRPWSCGPASRPSSAPTVPVVVARRSRMTSPPATTCPPARTRKSSTIPGRLRP